MLALMRAFFCKNTIDSLLHAVHRKADFMEIADIIKRKIFSFDYLMLILVVALSIFGIMVVGSATQVHLGADPAEFDKQKLWVATGLFLMFVAAFIDYRFIAKFYIILYVLNIGLLLAVRFFGDEMQSGVTRAVTIAGFSIQPSEFAKIFMLIFLVKLVDKLQNKLNNIFVLIGIGFSIIIPVFLVMQMPSLSASLVILCVSLVTLFIGGLSFKYIFSAIAVILPSAYLFTRDILSEERPFTTKLIELGILKSYQVETRILPYFNPDLASAADRYQVEQSVRAIGSGQLSGKGLFQGTMTSLSYVPSNHNDFIFSVIGEEFGYIGCICVLAVLFVIIVKCLYIAFRAKTLMGKLIASGVAFMLSFQTFVNVGVSIGMLPNTGMVLPFISYGGSSMWVNMIAIGLVINVSMVQPKQSAFTLFEE